MLKSKKMIMLLSILFAVTLSVLIVSNVNAIERGGTLSIAYDVEPNSLDPLFGDAPSKDRSIYNLFYETLLRIGPDGEREPILAECWNIEDNNQTITFNLRKGIKFHDGTDFNAEVAAYNLRRASKPDSPVRDQFETIESINVIDKYTLQIKLKSPSAIIFAVLAQEAGMMISPTALENLGEDYHRNPVGTGPMKFEKWLGGEQIEAVPFEKYWRNGDDNQPLPYLNKVVVRFIINKNVKLIELKSGNVDIIDGVPLIDFDTIEKANELKLLSGFAQIIQFMPFNMKNDIFSNNLKLRQAFLYGIDREIMCKALTYGFGTVNPTLTPKSSWAYDPNLTTYNYNPEKAKELLAEAGYEDGIELTLSVIHRDPDDKIAVIIKEQLKNIGIDLNVELLERQAWIDKVLNYEYECAILRAGVPRMDPHWTYGMHFGENAPQNWAGLTDPELWEYIKEASVNLDQEERKRLYSKAQQRLLDQAYYGFLFHFPVAEAINKRVHNLTRDTDGCWRLGEVWVENK